VLGGTKLKELPNGANRLSANRMLRIRKLLCYISERIDGVKEECLLEIVCEGRVLGLETTLASLKFQVWKGGGELEMRYRLKTS
jgi:WD repeat-containing protein 48